MSRLASLLVLGPSVVGVPRLESVRAGFPTRPKLLAAKAPLSNAMELLRPAILLLTLKRSFYMTSVGETLRP